MGRVLVIDDEKRIRDVYATLLGTEGYQVLTARDSVSANEILKRENIDLVLLDIKMPEVDGSIMHEIMRLFHRHIKVIVTSVYSTDEQRHIIKDAFDYYDKAQGLNRLLDKVKAATAAEKRIKKRVLIIDDESKIRNLFSRQLKESGYRVIGVAEGEMALHLLRKGAEIDLVILDILLPNCSGLDIFEKIKQEFPYIKVLISSVYSDDEQKFFIWNADDYYYKSDGLGCLIEKVERLINK